MAQCYVCGKEMVRGSHGSIDVDEHGIPQPRHPHCHPGTVLPRASPWERDLRRIIREEMRAALAELTLDDPTGGPV